MSDNIQQTITDFKQYLDRINMFSQAMGILSYDTETIAPDGGIEQRSKRAGFFSMELYNMSTSDTMKNYLEALAPHLPSLDKDVQAMYRLAKKNYDEGTKLPPELIKEFTELTVESSKVWEHAKENNDFAKFAPYLVRIIEMKKKMLGYRADEIPEGGVPYDVYLSDFEDDMTTKKYDKFFEELKPVIIPLIKQVTASEKKIETAFLSANVDKDTQRKVAKQLADKVQYNLNCGFIGESAHPFCNSIDSTDVRITTNYDKDDMLSSFYSVLHECGHAISGQGTGKDIAGTYLDGSSSMGMEEGQSRFYENVIGRSLPFWEHIADELRAILPKEYTNITPQMFYEAANRVKASLIRVEADELTYCLHVIIRYEIEKMIFSDACTVDELPGIWNQKYQEYLGITPPDDTNGVLQDVHWSWGLFGYFPSYALGSAYAAQLFSYMENDFDPMEAVRSGDFAKIKSWLNEKIHSHGQLYKTEQPMEMMFGEQLDVKYFAKYLNNKFGKLYNLQ